LIGINKKSYKPFKKKKLKKICKKLCYSYDNNLNECEIRLVESLTRGPRGSDEFYFDRNRIKII